MRDIDQQSVRIPSFDQLRGRAYLTKAEVLGLCLMARANFDELAMHVTGSGSLFDAEKVRRYLSEQTSVRVV